MEKKNVKELSNAAMQAERLAAIEAEKEQKKAEKENLNEMLEFFKAMNFTQQKAMIEELKKAKVNRLKDNKRD